MLVAVGLKKGARFTDCSPLAVGRGVLEAGPAEYAALDGVDEVAVLFTERRVEIFATSRCPAAATVALRRSLEARAGRELPLFELQGRSAFERLVRVAAGLEPASPGEPQILDQVKDAFARAVEVGVAGAELGAIAEGALRAATRVRQESAPGAAAPSWAQAAAVIAEKIVGPLRGRAVVVVGAGERARLSARHLASEGASVVVIDGALADADALALEVGGTARPVEALEGALLQADVVVSAAAAAPDALGPDAMAALVKRRRRRIVLVDLAVPRAIPEATGRVEDVYLCGVDDLDRVMAAAAGERTQAAAQAGRIVAEEVARWSGREAERRPTPLVEEIRMRATAIAHAELERTLRRLGDDPELARRLDAMAGSIVTKLLVAPSRRLERAARDGGAGEAIVAAAQRLFDLPGERAPRRPGRR